MRQQPAVDAPGTCGGAAVVDKKTEAGKPKAK